MATSRWFRWFFPCLPILIALLFPTRACPEEGETRIVAIQPLGEHDLNEIKLIGDAVTQAFGLKVVYRKAVPMPADAWYPKRKRHRADILLGHLMSMARGADFVIGATTQDISTTKGSHEDWGIFGLGQVGGQVCVVSSHRLKKKLSRSKRLTLGNERVRKVALHELGHVLGLPHCPTPGCLMHDAEGTVKTVDGENGAVCADCARFLREKMNLRQVPTATDSAPTL